MGKIELISEYDHLLEKLSNMPDILSCIEEMCGVFEINFITYHLAFHEGKAIDTPYVKTNYPANWVRQYLIMNYVDVDPVAQSGFRRALPCLWSDFDWDKPDIIPFATDAEKHGVGSAGYMIPISDRHHRRAMVNFSSALPTDIWAKKIQQIAPVLGECAELLHRKAVVDLYGKEDPHPPLSPRELECLSLVANGGNAKSIANKLEISAHTVRDYCKSARHKLGCATLFQAIHMATMERLINPV
ncbi:MAG: LuxR family transcriptional regulator [Rhizobiaceae bacterium]